MGAQLMLYGGSIRIFLDRLLLTTGRERYLGLQGSAGSRNCVRAAMHYSESSIGDNEFHLDIKQYLRCYEKEKRDEQYKRKSQENWEKREDIKMATCS